MLTMADLHWPSAGQRTVELTLDSDLLLSDALYQHRETKVAKAGERVSLWVTPNVGILTHPVYGHFHYLTEETKNGNKN